MAVNDYKPKFWARFVDDTFVVIKRRDKTGFMEKLNSIYPDIQFTAEANNTLPFLDVLIRHEHNGTLTTSVYHKTTHTDKLFTTKAISTLPIKLVVSRHFLIESIHISVQ